MNFLHGYHREFGKSLFRERYTVFGEAGAEAGGEADAGAASKRLRYLKDAMEKRAPKDLAPDTPDTRGRKEQEEEVVRNPEDSIEKERREYATKRILRHYYNPSFLNYLEKKLKLDPKENVVKRTLGKIIGDPKEFYYSEIGNRTVIRQRPENKKAMERTDFPVILDENGNLIKVGNLALNPDLWESIPDMPEVMPDYEMHDMQAATEVVLKHYHNPSFNIYLEDVLHQLPTQDGSVVKMLETVISGTESNNLQYHRAKNNLLIITKRHTGGSRSEVPEDFYIAIDTDSGRLVQAGKHEFGPNDWLDWPKVIAEITRINVAAATLKRVNLPLDRLNPQDRRLRDYVFFELPNRFFSSNRLRGVLHPVNRDQKRRANYRGAGEKFYNQKTASPAIVISANSKFQDTIVLRATIPGSEKTIGALAFSSEGYILDRDQSPGHFDDWHQPPEYQGAFYERRKNKPEPQFQNGVLEKFPGESNTIKRNEIYKNLPVYAGKIPDQIDGVSAVRNRATAKEDARMKAVEQLVREIHKSMGMTPDSELPPLTLPAAIDNAITFTYSEQRHETTATIHLTPDQKEEVLREFLKQNGIIEPFGFARLEKARAIGRAENADKTTAETEAKNAALADLAAKIAKAFGILEYSYYFGEDNLPAGVTINVSGQTVDGIYHAGAVIENITEEQMQALVTKFLEINSLDRSALNIPTAAEVLGQTKIRSILTSPGKYMHNKMMGPREDATIERRIKNIYEEIGIDPRLYPPPFSVAQFKELNFTFQERVSTDGAPFWEVEFSPADLRKLAQAILAHHGITETAPAAPIDISSTINIDSFPQSSYRPDTTQEKITFGAAINRYKEEMPNQKDALSPENYAVWYKIREGVASGGTLGDVYYYAEEIIKIIGNRMNEDIRSFFRLPEFGHLYIDTTDLENAVRDGKLDYPWAAWALSTKAVLDREKNPLPPEAEKAMADTLRKYLGDNAEAVIDIMAAM